MEKQLITGRNCIGNMAKIQTDIKIMWVERKLPINQGIETL